MGTGNCIWQTGSERGDFWEQSWVLEIRKSHKSTRKEHSAHIWRYIYISEFPVLPNAYNVYIKVQTSLLPFHFNSACWQAFFLIPLTESIPNLQDRITVHSQIKHDFSFLCLCLHLCINRPYHVYHNITVKAQVCLPKCDDRYGIHTEKHWCLSLSSSFMLLNIFFMPH